MQDFTKLQVWEKAHALTVSVYRATQRVKRGDFPGLVPQLRRSAASIPANIAEGCGHVGPKELARILQQAMASAFELEDHLILCAELGVLQRSICSDLHARVKEVKRMLGALIKRVRSAEPAKQSVRNRPEAGNGSLVKSFHAEHAQGTEASQPRDPTDRQP